MHLPIDFFLAFRYLRPKRSFLSLITFLSITGPALGTAILIIVTAVMSGFDRDIKRNILNMQPHVTVLKGTSSAIAGTQAPIRRPEQVMKAMSKLGLESAPSIHALCLIQKSQGMAIKQVRGILPEHEKDVSNIDDHIQAGSFDIEPGQAVIGLHMAEEFGLEIGDQLLIHAPDKLTDNVKWDENGELRIQEPDAVYLPEEIEIAGIFQVGVYELDLRVVYMHIDQAADLVGMDWGSATVVNARAPDPFELEPDVEKLQAQLPQYWITTWKDKNRRLFDAVQNEKTLIMFLLFFIVLVASFCISAMLITVVTQKTREIGLMKAVGYSRFMISRIFLLQGAIIGTFGTAVGVALGLLIIRFRTPLANGISRILNRQIFPQELYHLPEIPAHLTLPDLTLIACVSVLLCLFASVLPAIYAACLQPAKALQDDN